MPARSSGGGKVVHIPARDRGSAATSRAPRVGIVEWFARGDRDRVEQVLGELTELGAADLRTGISWPDWHAAGGAEWVRWLLGRLAERVAVLPVFSIAPRPFGAPSLAAPTSEQYADWVERVAGIASSGWIELWHEPHLLRWPQWADLADMAVVAASTRLRAAGARTLLGGLRVTDLSALRRLAEQHTLDAFDGIGLRRTREDAQAGWREQIEWLRGAMKTLRLEHRVWISEAGWPTGDHDEVRQLEELLEAHDSPVERLYWRSLHDAARPAPRRNGGPPEDDAGDGWGIKSADGTPKLAARLWLAEGGLDRVARRMRARPRLARGAGRLLSVITGGAGFVGCNLAERLVQEGHSVLLFDNLSRPGVERNAAWLLQRHGDRVELELGDTRDAARLAKAIHGAAQVFHLAAQVAVTTSLDEPMHDFEVNARGTLNLLEAVRGAANPPALLFTSTNKVYGGLPDVRLELAGKRYVPVDAELREHGIDERRPLDFHSPYGCSKGAADQYVLDYARTFRLPAAVLRMSCIYGARQFGNEDQGWVAHFLIRAAEGSPITLYGDGCQVRDILYVEDLVDALVLTARNVGRLAGQVFNIGGGPHNAISLLELIERIARLRNGSVDHRFEDWRPADQRYYVSDHRKLTAATGWRPKVDIDEGLRRLGRWVAELAGNAGAGASRGGMEAAR